MAAASHRWDDIEIHYHGATLTSTGHGFSGLSRRTLLEILASRCRELGVCLRFEREVRDPDELADADLVLAADGANSVVRERWRDRFQPTVDVRPNKFVWLGTTRPFPAFTFYFKPDAHGLWRVHAYQYEPERSTFIVEAREATWRAAGLDGADRGGDDRVLRAAVRRRAPGASPALQPLDLAELPDHPQRPLARTATSSLAGDAAHTAHFSGGIRHQARDGGCHRAGQCARAHDDRTGGARARTRPRAGPRSRACSARPRRASSGSRTPSATWTSSRSSSRSPC